MIGHSILANGTRTEHPIVGLPVTDDSALDLTDPQAIAGLAAAHPQTPETAPSRHETLTDTEDWIASTTNPHHPDRAWIVRRHPNVGTLVVSVKAAATESVYEHMKHRLITVSGGYSYTGTGWLRPRVVEHAHLHLGLPLGPEVEDAATRTLRDLREHDQLNHDREQGRGGLAQVFMRRGGDPSRVIGTAMPEKGPASTVGGRGWYDLDAAGMLAPTMLSRWAWLTDIDEPWEREHQTAPDPETAIIGLWASELEPSNLLTQWEVALELEVRREALAEALLCGAAPPPQETGPLRWSRPVVEAWSAHLNTTPPPAT